MKTIDGNNSFHETLFLLLNLNVVKSLSDHMQNHVSFDNPKSNFRFIIRNLTKPYQICYSIHILRYFFSTFILILVAYLQRHSRWIQAIWNTCKCFSGTSFFCQTGPLWFKLVTVCLNTATQGSDDLVWRRDKTH